MDGAEILLGLTELVKTAGISGAISLLTLIALITVIVMFSKRMQGLTQAIIILTDKVSSPYLKPEESLIIFRAIMSDHIKNKLDYLRETLTNNHIYERKNQIEKNIEREFKRITNMEAEKLSKFHTSSGDMGKTLLKEIKWKKFLDPVYVIFFGGDEISKKIDDIHGIMNEWVDRIASIIEDNGIHN
ncbi:hypothetical protein KAR91_62920 [Candidatus Pacearchaeota archaeon]|nr:hypothetical protein [Candidatus Pacearchaeota archaeon]